ncbi:MAG: S16 family serine protease [bacterium]|nr:S16 family serine protease [bacterium]
MKKRRRPDTGTMILTVSAALLMFAIAAMVVLPLPWMVRSPGPTLDTLGLIDDESVVAISGAETHETGEGQLLLTTVAVSGGPGRSITLLDAISGWLRPDAAVLPREMVYPVEPDPQEVSDFQIAQMNASQDFATAAALTELGYEITVTMTVAELMPDLPPVGELEVGDVLTAITPAGSQREELRDFGQLIGILEETAPGTEVTLEVMREGGPAEATFPTSPRPEGDEQPGSLLGVWLNTEPSDFPVDIDFDIDNIGGPSAGMMFALAIVDQLTPGELTGGKLIAGSGTMSIDGRVGAIGGIQQKLHGAVRDGASWFLVAEGNCSEALGNVPDGLEIAAVGTLADAVEAVEAIGRGQSERLTTCESVVAAQS